MKKFVVVLDHQTQIVYAEALNQADDFVSFYIGSPKVVVALVRMGPGDSIIEERKLAHGQATQT